MRNIKVLYAEVEYDGRYYIYSPDGKPAGVKTGKPHFRNLTFAIEFLASLDAGHLYPLEESDDPQE